MELTESPAALAPTPVQRKLFSLLLYLHSVRAQHLNAARLLQLRMPAK